MPAKLGLLAITALLAVSLAVSMAVRPAVATTPIVANGSWTVYHHDNGHTGFDSSLGPVSSVTPGWTSATLDGEVYAEPLVSGGIVYIATLNNTVYALNQTDGSEIWHVNLSTPKSGGWVCGNFAQQGILGTPVIDVAANRIYVTTFSSDSLYRVIGLDLGTGASRLSTNIPASIGTGFDWTIQQQRGALAVANGYVYVPFGGRAGDCGSYRGWVVGVPTDGVSALKVFETPSTAEGIWAAGGVLVDDATHNVIFATGNAIPCSGSSMSDSIIRTSATLSSAAFFQPSDWQANWCGPDSDLGSASPVLINPNLMFTAGKHGGGFLLDPNSLTGANSQRFPSPSGYTQADVCAGNHGNATFGSFAYAAPFVYVECDNNGLVALNVNTAAPSFSACGSGCGSPDWRAGGNTTFGPPIVAAGAVWVASNSGLTAYDAATGALIYQSAAFGVNRFVTPAEAGGQVFVPAHRGIRAFDMQFAGGSVSPLPGRLDFNGHAPNTPSSPQTVTLHNNQPVALHVTTAALGGANAGQYLKAIDTCSGQTLAAGATCSVQVSFKATAFGGFPAHLDFTDDGPGSPQSTTLSGLGAIDNQGHLYTLDGWGGLHADGSAPVLASATYWPGWNIARSVALFPDGQGGYVMDGYGGLHPVGNANAITDFAYWAGWDIARQAVLAPWASRTTPAGWTLDGYGGVHPFGGAPAIANFAYWGGWDIARGLVLLPDSTPSSVAGYTLDGYGGVHPFGGAPAVSNFAYWSGWDIARGITLSAASSNGNLGGWTLDGYGGLHPFGTALAYTNFAYWGGWDIARGIVTWTGAGTGGWVLDGWGGIHPFGGAPSVSGMAYWQGWDIATGLAGANFGTSSIGKK